MMMDIQKNAEAMKIMHQVAILFPSIDQFDSIRSTQSICI